jgi:hypothetical protein
VPRKTLVYNWSTATEALLGRFEEEKGGDKFRRECGAGGRLFFLVSRPVRQLGQVHWYPEWVFLQMSLEIHFSVSSVEFVGDRQNQHSICAQNLNQTQEACFESRARHFNGARCVIASYMGDCWSQKALYYFDLVIYPADQPLTQAFEALRWSSRHNKG